MSIIYEEILGHDDLNSFEPQYVVGCLGLVFETARELGKIQDLKKGLDIADKQIFDNFRDHDKMIFHYNVANGWSYLQILTQKLNSNSFWSFNYQELEKQIINLRLALKYSATVNDDFNKCQILTNLGNLFSHIGRFSEAQQFWQEAIKISPEFPMAIGNIGFGLLHYAKVLYDIKQQRLFFIIAYKYLSRSLDLEISKEAKETFQTKLRDLESHFGRERLRKIPDLESFSLGKSNSEKKYRSWCLTNQLFLNPLNDITVQPIAANDCFLLPSMLLKIDQSPIYQTVFNQIKQEFVSARYLLFEGTNHKRHHFSDLKNLQMDTLDYATYSFSIEKIKIAFRICYSLLDKIGYLLNDYLELGFKPDKVTFRKIWYEYRNSKPIGLNHKITRTQNWAFRGLFWLSTDLYENNDLIFTSSIEPDAHELATIRNFIEHKSFKTVEFGDSELVDNGLTFKIARNEFEIKTINLFKLIRSAIIYLSLGINLEERKKDKDHPMITIDFIAVRDDDKY